MSYDPLSEVIDEPLHVDKSGMEQLRIFRRESKLANLPGVDVRAEGERLTTIVNDLTDRLLNGIERAFDTWDLPLEWIHNLLWILTVLTGRRYLC